MPWLALTVEVEAAAAEAFSDALLESGAQSVTLQEAKPGWLSHRVTALLEPRAQVDALVARAALAAAIPVPAFSTSQVEDRDWVRQSQAQFEPFALGDRLWVGPSWMDAPRNAAATISLDPGLAFGTGSHATTRLVLQYLVEEIKGGERVLDYGCGSGILAIAAAKLGAAQVDAVDIDPQAVETTAANASVNGVALRSMETEALAAGTYDIIVSNILAQPLIVLAPLFAGRSVPGGRIALSGLLESQADEVAAGYANRYAMRVARTREGWALLAGVLR
jgi:ribosomal protein L11 methyltransferase